MEEQKLGQEITAKKKHLNLQVSKLALFWGENRPQTLKLLILEQKRCNSATYEVKHIPVPCVVFGSSGMSMPLTRLINPIQVSYCLDTFCHNYLGQHFLQL